MARIRELHNEQGMLGGSFATPTTCWGLLRGEQGITSDGDELHELSNNVSQPRTTANVYWVFPSKFWVINL